MPAPVIDIEQAKTSAIDAVDAKARRFSETNRAIWGWAEPSLLEYQSSALLADLLEEHGFAVERGVAGLPTAFVATWGSGAPVIGVMAEYDALPGLSQAAEAENRPLVDGGYGHGCGHSVFGTASVFAAIAAKEAAERAGITGRIRCFGTPAEETAGGKMFMIRAGCFEGSDIVFAWHPGDETGADFHTLKAIVSARFTFFGRTSHAAFDPFHGRSALDAVELMNVGVNYIREHVKDDARIHYVITDGGRQPNVVPDRASVWYYIRADKWLDVESYVAWISDIALGAALMTQTRVERVIDSESHDMIPNRPLAEAIDRNLQTVGPPKFDDADRAFAAKIRATLTDVRPGPALSEVIRPLAEQIHLIPASSDVGDVSWVVPVGHLSAATEAIGTPGHSWQVTATSGGPIGEKGGMVAAKALATTVLDALTSSELRRAAWADFDRRRSAAEFRSLVPADLKPNISKV
jgi:aminobenzoyl-glutamate utilization protein B